MNAVYAVVNEGVNARQIVLPHEGKRLALDTSSFVPLVLDGAPEPRRDDRGNLLLYVRLAPKYAKALEDLTRSHLGEPWPS